MMCDNCKDGRYWVIDPTEHKVYGDDTFGVVDEHAGGIVAYVGSEAPAKQLVRLLEAD